MPIRSREYLGSGRRELHVGSALMPQLPAFCDRARERGAELIRRAALAEEGAVDRLAAWIGSTKVDAYSTHSTLWRPRPPAQPTVVVSSAAVAIVKTTKTTLALKPRKI